MSVLGGHQRTHPAIVACELDDYRALEHHLLPGFPHDVCHSSAGVPLVGDIGVAEELPACASGAVPSSCGPPGLRDGGVIPQAAQNVDGAEQSQGGAFLFLSHLVQLGFLSNQAQI